MAYERDTDHATRGVGAIAAADSVSVARQRRRVQVGRATRLRDQHMAGIAMGALSIKGLSTPAPAPAAQYHLSPNTGKSLSVAWGGPTAPTQQPRQPVLTTVFPDPVPRPTTPIPTSSPLPTTVSTPIRPVATMGGGGGGSVLPSGGPGGTAMIIDPPPVLPPIPEPVEDNTARNVKIAAISAGAAVAAYLLFFRKRSP